MIKMFVTIITAFIILHITVAKDVVDSTKTKNSVRYDNDNFKKLMERIDQLEKNMNKRLDQQDIRLDRLENNGLNMESNNRNITMVMETIVEQQMVITAEIFTVSQTLPFCCCQYQNTTDSGTHESTTNDPGKIETSTTELTTSKTSFCAEAMGEYDESGVYKIHVTNSGLDPFDVYCMKSDNKETNGTWLIIQRRQDGSTDFNQGWKMYQRGFGDLNRSFWIGLDKLYALTNSAEHELWVQLTISNGTQCWALYSNFSIGNETESYALKSVGTFKSSVYDTLTILKGHKWSTYDNHEPNNTCAERYKGAWWQKKGCAISHLNGIYGGGNKDNKWFDLTLMRWDSYPETGKYIVYAHMAIRPRQSEE